MKKTVLELLAQKDLTHIFNQSDYNTYKNKLYKVNNEPNKYLMALAIMDLFIFNSPPSC